MNVRFSKISTVRGFPSRHFREYILRSEVEQKIRVISDAELETIFDSRTAQHVKSARSNSRSGPKWKQRVSWDQFD